MTESPTSEEDADLALEVVAAGTCVSETSPLVSEQELTAISERHTTATSSFEMLRSWHKLRAQSGHLTACCVRPVPMEPELRGWLDIAPDSRTAKRASRLPSGRVTPVAA